MEVKDCLAQGASANAPRRDGGLPIHKAAEYTEHPEVISALIDAGADPMARTGKYRSTPLHIASGSGKKQTRLGRVKVLLASGANPNAQDIDGETPLHRALGRAYGFLESAPEVLRALVEAGADPNLMNERGESPMGWANSDRNRRILAAAGGERKQNGGSGILGAIVVGATAGGVAAASGARLVDSLAVAEAVITGQPPTHTAGEEVAHTEPRETDPNVAVTGSGSTAGADVLDPEERTRRLEERERIRQVERDRQATRGRTAKTGRNPTDERKDLDQRLQLHWDSGRRRVSVLGRTRAERKLQEAFVRHSPVKMTQ